MLFNKAILTQDHYTYFYYADQFVTMEPYEDKIPPRNEAKALGRYPDILYSSSYDGEIAIEWNEKKKSLEMLTLIDLTGLAHPSPRIMEQMIDQFQKANHPNLLNLNAKAVMLDDVQTLVFRSESPDHISTWKQFCKTEMSLFHTLSLFR
jgi:hypothetical protein